MKIFLLTLCFFVFTTSCQLRATSLFAAQEDKQLVGLTKQIIEAKSAGDLYALFAQLKELYYKDKKYSEFVELLNSLKQKKNTAEPLADYYIAEARYSQLKNLEVTQGWDEYFAKGNDYRDQITGNAAQAIALTSAKEPVNIYARLLLWKFHKDQEDSFKDSSLDELMSGALEYSQASGDSLLVKETADQLSAYGQKGKSKELYKIYVDKLVSSQVKDKDLKASALNFYKDGNLDLSETLYDVYIDRIYNSAPQEKIIPELTDIAKAFVYSAENPNNDPLYAEKIFKKIEDKGGKEAFNEELMYLRANNLEKYKDFSGAKNVYALLLERFPESAHTDEADYKAGIIYAYVSKDLKSAREIFERLAQKETMSPQVISGLYQLGLLYQWEKDLEKAKTYYNKLLEKAKDGYLDSAALAKERLGEIEENKSIEYNLKTFLDASLKDEFAEFSMTKLDLKSSSYKVKTGAALNVASHPYIGQNGCFQIELQYLWSGNLGAGKPSSSEASFGTNYAQPGTKEVNLVVISPSGIVDRDINLLDID